MTGVLMKRGHSDTDMPPGRVPCKDRDGGDAPTSEEMPKIVGNPSEARGETGNKQIFLPWEAPSQLTLGSWTSHVQNWERIHFVV